MAGLIYCGNDNISCQSVMHVQLFMWLTKFQVHVHIQVHAMILVIWRPRWPMGHGSHGSWVKSSVGHLGHGSLWMIHSLLCRNRLHLLTNHTLHYDHRRHPSRAMVLNVWTQGTIAWYVTSAHLLCIWWLWTLTYDLNLWTWPRYLGQRLFHASCSTFTHEITFHLDICHAASPWPSLG